MKAKALRYKESKEFIYIQELGGEPSVFTSDLPNLHPMTATIELIGGMLEDNDFYEGLDLDLDAIELVELDIIESGKVGADIRNKLGNYNSLVQMVELLLMEKDHERKIKLKKLVRKEIKLGHETVKYLANLL